MDNRVGWGGVGYPISCIAHTAVDLRIRRRMDFNGPHTDPCHVSCSKNQGSHFNLNMLVPPNQPPVPQKFLYLPKQLKERSLRNASTTFHPHFLVLCRADRQCDGLRIQHLNRTYMRSSVQWSASHLPPHLLSLVSTISIFIRLATTEPTLQQSGWWPHDPS